jgi:hypothetical protein
VRDHAANLLGHGGFASQDPALSQNGP